MKAKQIARLFAIVLTLVTMVSCLAVVMTTETSAASSSIVYTGEQLLANANGVYGFSKFETVWDGTEKVLKMVTNNSDPYFQLTGMTSTSNLETYPYMVVRYKTSELLTMETYRNRS